jgi:3-methyladenine DNA glycosylase/8-oxoguanine DNA glycosylase
MSAVRGVGSWTAQWFLLFQQRGLDVRPTSGVGLWRGYGRAWHVPTPTSGVLEGGLVEEAGWAGCKRPGVTLDRHSCAHLTAGQKWRS